MGRILHATGDGGTLRVAYTFDHAGRAYTGSLQITDAVTARTVRPDAPLFVFFAPDRPEHNVAVLESELPPSGAPSAAPLSLERL
ncbi:MAG: hypothetical protein IAG13_37200 [Deltaproteobacteria bacterium]|nr:hypothetical protein [Nannocystaceae bacterium]